MDCIDVTLELFEKRGADAYLGEPVSQLEHALQAAHLAVMNQAPDSLVAAALLHDVGHLLIPEPDGSATSDLLHEKAGGEWLTRHFRPAVAEPVRLHVAAKRYLCTVDPAYRLLLSPASIESLKLQGGLFSRAEIHDFERNPFHSVAVQLRRWDDDAKVEAHSVPGLDCYTTTLRRLVTH
jgi:phosphonate degradation associated HDIG domain protein